MGRQAAVVLFVVALVDGVDGVDGVDVLYPGTICGNG